VLPRSRPGWGRPGRWPRPGRRRWPGGARGWRGPRSFAGEYTSGAAGFASGKPLDAAPGCAALGLFAEDAAGEDGRYADAADDEVLGLICAWDRVEAHMSARKHAAVAELIR
jgi:hypothetical protein